MLFKEKRAALGTHERTERGRRRYAATASSERRRGTRRSATLSEERSEAEDDDEDEKGEVLVAGACVGSRSKAAEERPWHAAPTKATARRRALGG